MTPESIGNAVINILKSKQVFLPGDFAPWVDLKNGYQQIQLEDHSEWVVRKGIEAERYIHLHPSRTSQFTTRFKGSTLKTVYLLKAGFANFQEPLSLERVNNVRMQIGLSPIKKLDRNKGILNCYEKFFSKPQTNETDSHKS
jgi:hypothetical protein